MLPVLEYLYRTAPRTRTGLSAFDVSTGVHASHGLRQALAPLQVPHGIAATDVASTLFKQFSELYQPGPDGGLFASDEGVARHAAGPAPGSDVSSVPSGADTVEPTL